MTDICLAHVRLCRGKPMKGFAMNTHDSDFIGPPTKPEKLVKLVPKKRPTSFIAASEDAELMKRIEKWKIHRARSDVARAEQQLGYWFGESREAITAMVDAAVADENEVKRLEWQIAQTRPETFRATRAIMEMVMTILAQREIDPHGRLSDGPLIQLLGQAVRKLEDEWDEEKPSD